MIEIDILNYANIVDKLQRLNYEVIAREKMFKYIANHNFEHFEERYNIFMEDYTIKLYDYEVYKAQVFRQILPDIYKDKIINRWAIIYDDYKLQLWINEE